MRIKLIILLYWRKILHKIYSIEIGQCLNPTLSLPFCPLISAFHKLFSSFTFHVLLKFPFKPSLLFASSISCGSRFHIPDTLLGPKFRIVPQVETYCPYPSCSTHSSFQRTVIGYLCGFYPPRKRFQTCLISLDRCRLSVKAKSLILHRNGKRQIT